jgi:hypothetical protein
MALKSNFNEAASMRDLQKQADILNRKILNSFIRAGEEFVTNARSQGQSHALGQYEDQTTNLRNSIGYYVFYDGMMVRGNNNILSNLAVAEEVVNTKGFQLVGIAGMNYASHVESKGYNVISYQADICVVDLTSYLVKLEVIER